MRHIKSGLLLAGLVAMLFGCGGGGGSSSSSSGGNSNRMPIANAGAAQTVIAGATVTLNGSASSDPDGSIAAYVWTQTAGAAVTLSSTTVAQPTFTAPPVATGTILTFSLRVTDDRGATSAPATVNVTVNPATGMVEFNGRVRFARVNFTPTGTPLRPLNYASPVFQPSRGVVVRALDAGTPVERAVTTTDENGEFSFSLPANIDIDIQVEARLRRTGAAPTWDIRVQDGIAGNSPYTHTHATAFNSSVGTLQTIDIPLGINASGNATGTRASGPFAILDTLYSGVTTVLSVAPTAALPPLIVDWGSQADGTFFSGGNPQHMALLSDLTEDTDEFDQHVIAHEFGHYIEFNFSRADNIGGAHALGDKLDPRVAFGEGFGYAFAAIVLGNTDSRDSFFGDITPTDGIDNPVHASGGFNVETNPVGANGCWCSESSVYSILYDLYDTAPDGADAVSLGFQPIWNVLTGTQRTTPAFTTIFSFITALKAAQPANAAAIDDLIAAQNITTNMDAFGTTETQLPAGISADSILPLYTTVTPGTGPVVLRSTNDLGTGNKLGNRRYVRFSVATTRNITISLSTSNPNPGRDPDFMVWRAGTFIRDGTDPPSEFPETETFEVTPGTYLVDIYDCANGCNPTEPPDGTGSGDYDLTVTIQ